MGRTIERNLAMILLILAALLFVMSWLKFVSPYEYVSTPGEWEKGEMGTFDESWQTELPAYQPVKLVFEYYAYADKGMLLTYEAEGGEESVQIETGFSAKLTPYSYGQAQPVELAALSSANDRRGEVHMTITSKTNQRFRTAVKWDKTAGTRPEDRAFGHLKNLCWPTNYNCLEPITSIALPKTAAMIEASAKTGFYWAGGMVAVAIVLLIGIAKVIALVFPSGAVRRVRSGLNTDNKYKKTASNPLSRAVDIEELDTMLEEARAEKSRIDVIERKNRTAAEEEADALKEYGAQIEKTKEAEAKLDEIQKRNRKTP